MNLSLETSNAGSFSSSISMCFSNRSSTRSSVSPTTFFSSASRKVVSRRSFSPSTKFLTFKSDNIIRDAQNNLKNIKDKPLLSTDINSEIKKEDSSNEIKNEQLESQSYYKNSQSFKTILKNQNQNSIKDSDDENWF